MEFACAISGSSAVFSAATRQRSSRWASSFVTPPPEQQFVWRVGQRPVPSRFGAACSRQSTPTLGAWPGATPAGSTGRSTSRAPSCTSRRTCSTGSRVETSDCSRRWHTSTDPAPSSHYLETRRSARGISAHWHSSWRSGFRLRSSRTSSGICCRSDMLWCRASSCRARPSSTVLDGISGIDNLIVTP